MGKQCQTLFFGASKSLQMVIAAMKLRHLLLGRKVMTNLESILKSKDITNKRPSSQGYGFSSSRVWIWQLYYKESWVPKNWCLWTVVLEKTLESPSLGLQGDTTSPSWRRSVLGVHWKDWCWRWNCNTLATSCAVLTHWKRSWCWEELGAGGEGDDRGWDSWMASLTWWTWVWVNSRSWWRKGGLMCCDSWGYKESDTTEWLNWLIDWGYFSNTAKSWR